MKHAIYPLSLCPRLFLQVRIAFDVTNDSVSIIKYYDMKYLSKVRIYKTKKVQNF